MEFVDVFRASSFFFPSALPRTLPSGTFALPSKGKLSVKRLVDGLRAVVFKIGGLCNGGLCGTIVRYAGGVGGKDGTLSSMLDGKEGALLMVRSTKGGIGRGVFSKLGDDSGDSRKTIFGGGGSTE